MKQAERTGVEPVSDIEFTSAPYLVDNDSYVKIPLTEEFQLRKGEISHVSENNDQCELT